MPSSSRAGQLSVATISGEQLRPLERPSTTSAASLQTSHLPPVASATSVSKEIQPPRHLCVENVRSVDFTFNCSCLATTTVPPLPLETVPSRSDER